MTETLSETQLRLLLEQQCAQAFRRIKAELPDEDCSLLFFDYGGAGHIAFATTLDRLQLVETFSELVKSWRAGVPRTGFVDDEWKKVHTVERMSELGDLVTPPPGVGFALLVGRGAQTSYIATGDREGVQATLENELLPRWRSVGP